MEHAWMAIKRSITIGAMVRGAVVRHEPFGVFVSIEGVSFPGLIQITDFKDSARMTPQEYPPLGTTMSAVVLGYQKGTKQIWLGVKPSQMLKASTHPQGWPD